MIVYRAGYIEDLEFNELSNPDEILELIRKSRHWPQIRYVVIRSEKILFNEENLRNFSKPLILLGDGFKLYNMSEEDFKILLARGFIDDGLNITRMISNLIKVLR